MVRRGRITGEERDAWLVGGLESLVRECASVEGWLRGRATAVNHRLQEEAQTARRDAAAALEAVGSERPRLLRSALYATRQVERLLKELDRRSLLPPDVAPRTLDLIIDLRMDFLRRLLPPP
jgi:hypothetical protein